MTPFAIGTLAAVLVFLIVLLLTVTSKCVILVKQFNRSTVAMCTQEGHLVTGAEARQQLQHRRQELIHDMISRSKAGTYQLDDVIISEKELEETIMKRIKSALSDLDDWRDDAKRADIVRALNESESWCQKCEALGVKSTWSTA